MTIAVLKRRGGDAMGDFWQVEVSAGHATITRGHVGKLHDDTEFVLLTSDIPLMFEGLAWAYRENRHALSPAERERILNIMTGD